MLVLTECLFDLYESNQESTIYYDEEGLLEKFLNELNDRMILKKYPFDDVYKETRTNQIASTCLVNLTCLAYKSNLIKNEFLVKIYDYLQSVCLDFFDVFFFFLKLKFFQ